MRSLTPTHVLLPVLIAALLASLMTSCAAPDATPGTRRASGSFLRSAATPSTPSNWPARYGLGHAASPAAISAMDTDVDTTGAGLPDGSGTVADGAIVFAAKCASCHGAKGEGIPPAPTLVMPIAPNDSFPWGAKKTTVPKTLGNYWPFATTAFAYIRHTMPLAAPGSLTPTEVYQVLAYLLAENGVMPRDVVLNAQSLAALKLPMRQRFVPDNRRGGAAFR